MVNCELIIKEVSKHARLLYEFPPVVRIHATDLWVKCVL